MLLGSRFQLARRPSAGSCTAQCCIRPCIGMQIHCSDTLSDCWVRQTAEQCSGSPSAQSAAGQEPPALLQPARHVARRHAGCHNLSSPGKA